MWQFIQMLSAWTVADNVIAGWGETKEWDGRNGDQPRNTLVAQNFIHELGFFEKQSSAFFQAKTALTTIKDNGEKTCTTDIYLHNECAHSNSPPCSTLLALLLLVAPSVAFFASCLPWLATKTLC